MINDDSARLSASFGCRYYRPTSTCSTLLNPLIATLKPQSNGPSYSNTMIGTLAADVWAVTFGTARRGLHGLWPRPVLSSLYHSVDNKPKSQ